MHLKLKKLYNCSFHHYLRQWEKEWEEEAHLIYPPYAFFAPARPFLEVTAQKHASLELSYLQAVQKQMHFHWMTSTL